MGASSLELTIVVPTFREAGNVLALIELTRSALRHVEWEMIFVDDNSNDGTADLVWSVGLCDRRVRCLKRVGRRGLSSACIEGLLGSPAPFLAVMDADLQHDPGILSGMLEKLRGDEADLVLASRYMPGGSVGDWNDNRVKISVFATRLAGLITRQPVSDPMSGYFMMRREVFEAALPKLSSIGFKILLDVIASSSSGLRLVEVPLKFGKRLAGESKLSTNVAWEYILLIGDKLFGHYIPVRFVAFAAVGAFGALLHFLVLFTVFRILGQGFSAGQAAAVVVAVVFNYTLNNILTYGDSSLKGPQWWRGLLSFALVCGIGAVANVGIASFLFTKKTAWPIAAVAGIFVGSVWNYAVTSRYTWKKTN